MEIKASLVLSFSIGTVFGMFVLIIILRLGQLKVERLDEKTLLIKLPLLGKFEVFEREYKGIFIRGLMDSLLNLQRFIDLQTMLRYASRYNINYVGIEGNLDGRWEERKLAFCTLSKGHKGGYNIHLNPNLDCKKVSAHLSKQLNIEVRPEEVYPFLFFHEIGHTIGGGENNYFVALVNHSLSGGRRAARRRRALKNLYLELEKYADEFAIEELLKWRLQRVSIGLS